MDRRNNHRHIQESLFSEFQIEQIKPLNFFQQNARWMMGFFLGLSDVVSMLSAFGLVILLRNLFFGTISLVQYRDLLLYVLMLILVYAWHGLYPGVGLSPVDELKRLSSATSLSFLTFLAISFFKQTSAEYSRFVLGFAWLISLVLVQFDRWILRILGSKLGLWGEPVAVIGNGPKGRQIVNFLKNNARLGMRPILHLSGKSMTSKNTLYSINKSKISTVILVTAEMSKELQRTFVYEQRFGYHRRKGEKDILQIILISSLSWVGSLGIVAHDMDGMIGLEVRQNLLRKGDQIFKRFVDLFIASVFGLFFFPFLLVLMVCIVIDSPGGVFHKQKRVGHGGQIFEMWKFRTMFSDSEHKLEKYLTKNPDLKKEWDEKQKIKNDPRITRVGKFLRKLSLDEVPQVINVIKGEMSIVGPRPIFSDQRESFREWINLYQRVKPGITGMWQVSGRSNISFIGEERARLDEYYIRNWSLWLDIYIILRTFWVVLIQDGAY